MVFSGTAVSRGLDPFRSYCTVSQSCQCTTGIPARTLKNQTKNPKAGRNARGSTLVQLRSSYKSGGTPQFDISISGYVAYE
jgi:hypothetical protein